MISVINALMSRLPTRGKSQANTLFGGEFGHKRQNDAKSSRSKTKRMLKLGIILTAATVTILVVEFFRTRRRALPAHGWLGLIALVCAEFLMFHGIEPAATYFSPLAWTAYILLADAATFAITGQSRLREEGRGFLKMAALSVPLWLI